MYHDLNVTRLSNISSGAGPSQSLGSSVPSTASFGAWTLGGHQHAHSLSASFNSAALKTFSASELSRFSSTPATSLISTGLEPSNSVSVVVSSSISSLSALRSDATLSFVRSSSFSALSGSLSRARPSSKRLVSSQSAQSLRASSIAIIRESTTLPLRTTTQRTSRLRPARSTSISLGMNTVTASTGISTETTSALEPISSSQSMTYSITSIGTSSFQSAVSSIQVTYTSSWSTEETSASLSTSSSIIPTHTVTSMVPLEIVPVPLRSVYPRTSLTSITSPTTQPTLVSAATAKASNATLSPPIVGAIVGTVVSSVILIALILYCIRLRHRRSLSNFTKYPDTPPQIPAFATWPSRHTPTPVQYAYLKQPLGIYQTATAQQQPNPQVLGTSLLVDPFSPVTTTNSLQLPPPAHSRAHPPPLTTSPFLQHLDSWRNTHQPFNPSPGLPSTHTSTTTTTTTTTTEPPNHTHHEPRPPDPNPEPNPNPTLPPRNPRRLLFPESTTQSLLHHQLHTDLHLHDTWTPRHQPQSRAHDPTLTPRLPTPSPHARRPPAPLARAASSPGARSFASSLAPPSEAESARRSPAAWSCRSDPFDLEGV